MDTSAFFVTNPFGSTKLKLDERFGLKSPIENNFRFAKNNRSKLFFRVSLY